MTTLSKHFENNLEKALKKELLDLDDMKNALELKKLIDNFDALEPQVKIITGENIALFNLYLENKLKKEEAEEKAFNVNYSIKNKLYKELEA
jgi:hypothetical protein